MKITASALLLTCITCITLLFSSCETDIDVSAEWKDITVVYGLIDQRDTTHLLRINKAFLGDGNSLEYAKEPDSSSYFNNLEVTLTRVDKDNQQQIYVFDTIHVDNKEEGIFYSPSQILYRSDFKFPSDFNSSDEDYRYDLYIRNKITGKEIRSTTRPVKNFDITTPRFGQRSIDFITDNNQKIVWYSAKNGRRYDVVIRFWFQEVFDANVTDTIDRYIDWQVGSMKSFGLNGGEEMTMLYRPTALYDIAKVLIPYKDEREGQLRSRLTNKVEFTVIVAGDEMNTYIEVNNPSTGINQDTPDYSNIENGLGLFSSRYVKFNSIAVGAKTEALFMEIEGLKFVDKLGN